MNFFPAELRGRENGALILVARASARSPCPIGAAPATPLLSSRDPSGAAAAGPRAARRRLGRAGQLGVLGLSRRAQPPSRPGRRAAAPILVAAQSGDALEDGRPLWLVAEPGAALLFPDG